MALKRKRARATAVPGRTGQRARQTRAAFVTAARGAFARYGYEGVGLREIAAAAGADKRLITRYFGSKEQLFAEALASSVDKFRMARADTGRLGRLFAERTFGDSDLTEADRLAFISICIRSAASPVGRRLVRANVRKQIGEIAALLDGADAAVRAALLLVVFFGTALVREVLDVEELATLSVEKALTYIAPRLQSLVDPPAKDACG